MCGGLTHGHFGWFSDSRTQVLDPGDADCESGIHDEETISCDTHQGQGLGLAVGETHSSCAQLKGNSGATLWEGR